MLSSRKALLLLTFFISSAWSNQPEQSCISKWRQGAPLHNNTYSPSFSEPYDLNLKGSWNLQTAVDFLLWVPKETGLELSINRSLDPELFKSSISPISYDYKPAFRVSLGYVFDKDNWNPVVEYTRFYSSSNGHANYEKGFSSLLPVWVKDKQQMARARSHWRLKFDIIDAAMSRPHYFGEKLSITPKIGVRTFLLKQKYKLLYTSAFGFEDIRSNNSSHSWATGPVASCQGRFNIGRGFRIQSNIHGALIYQKLKTRLRQKAYSDQSTLTEYHKDSFFQITPNLEASLGIGYSTFFSDNRSHFDLFAGYDFVYYWKQNSMRKLNDQVNNGVQGSLGELMLHGLTLSFQFAY